MDKALDPELRYSRCVPALSKEELSVLRTKKAAVIGCGGLGGYILEMLARAGIGAISFADPDVFEPSNLNRQILATEATIGREKVREAEDRLRQIRPDIRLSAFQSAFSVETAGMILDGCDIVLDALDNGETRITLARKCTERNLMLIHGAVSEWYAQVCTIPPGSGIMDLLYPDPEPAGITSSLPFLPPLCASVQVSEAVRFLVGRPCALTGTLLFLDTETMTWHKTRIWDPHRGGI